MKLERNGPRLDVSELPELSVMNADAFRDQVQAALPPRVETLEIDLSQTRYVDSSGLGALFALYQVAGGQDGVMLRLINPHPPVRQLLELTQLHQLFEIVKR